MVIGRNIFNVSNVYATLILSFFFLDLLRSISCDAINAHARTMAKNSIHKIHRDYLSMDRRYKTRTGIKIIFKLMANNHHNYMKVFILGNIIQVSSS